MLKNDRSIELNAKGNDGKTLFMCACNIGHKDVVYLKVNEARGNVLK